MTFSLAGGYLGSKDRATPLDMGLLQDLEGSHLGRG